MQKGFIQRSFGEVGLAPIIIVLIIAALAGAFYLGKTQSKPISPTPAQKATQATPIPDETANWKTYTNNKLRFSFKYPVNAALYENKTASVDGVFVDSPDSVQLNLPVSCGQGMADNSLLTIIVSNNKNAVSFGSPNAFSSDIETQQILFSGEKAAEAKGVPGLYGSDQIGVQKDGSFYLVKGEPCFTQEARKILSTFRFTR